MKKKHIEIIIISIFVMLGSLSILNAQTPIWASSYGAQTTYSKQEYFTGFGMASINKDITTSEAITQAKTMAKEDLTQKIQVKIEVSNTLLTEQYNSGNEEEYTTSFLSDSKLSVNQELFGLKIENYVDEQEDRVYALANIRREAIKRQYQDRVENLQNEFNSLQVTMQKNADKGRDERAFELAMQAKAEYTKMVEAWSVLNSLSRQKEWHPQKVSAQVESINKIIDEYLNRPVGSIDDAAWWLANTMGDVSQDSIRLNISAITYRNTGISSEFANYLRQVLTRQLNKRTNWIIEDIGQTYKRNPDHILTGTFWDRGDDIHVLANVRETESGQIVAASETSIPSAVMQQEGFALLPDNYESAMADLKALENNKGDNRGLQLEAWTNRGKENLVFAEGEILEVSLQVNLPSYIRIIYHLKDGRRVLLVNSHYINERDVNKPYILPYQFECVPPFGIENMQIIAQSEPFERAETKMVDEMPILTEDLEKFLSKTRGFKIKKQEAQQTEEVLTITTMRKKVNN